MRGGQAGDGRDRAAPVVARFVRVDGGGVEQLAGGVDDSDLAAGADARVDAHGHVLAGRRGEQQVLQVLAEDADGFFLGALAQFIDQFEFEVGIDLDLPGPAHGVLQPFVGRAILRLDAEAGGDALFARARSGLDGVFVEFGIEHQRDVEEAFVAPAQQGQRAVRGHVDDGFGEIEPVAEFGAFGFLAFDDGRPQKSVFLQVVAQRLQQLRVFGELFHQDLAGAVEHGLGVGEAGVGVEVFFGFVVRRQLRVVEQCQRQRLDAGFAGDLGLGPAFLLVRQVKVFETLLGFGIFDHRPQFRRQLALFLDAGENGAATVFEFAQVAETLFQVAQLRVVEFAGDFLPVAGDEGHGGAFVEELDGGLDLGGADIEFDGDAVFDGSEHGCGSAAKRGVNNAQS